MTPGLAFVTGAYGYLGAAIRARLELSGWRTVALVRSPRPGDLALAWSLGEAPPDDVDRADALIHCAYDFGPHRRQDIWRVNVDGSTLLLREAKNLAVGRILVLSSMSAYVGTGQIYGQAKLAIEQITLNVGGIAVRPGLVYGPSPAGMAGTLVKLTKLPVVPLMGTSAQQFPVHESDLTQAIAKILEAPAWTPEVFGIAQPVPVSFRTLVATLAREKGRTCHFLPLPWRMVYGLLRLAELAGASLPVRSDSVFGLVRPAPFVPRSVAFPEMLPSLRSIP